MTTPQPKLPFWLRLILILLSPVLGISLLFLSVCFLLAYVYILFAHPALQLRFMLMGLILGVLWLAYIELAASAKVSIGRWIRKASK